MSKPIDYDAPRRPAVDVDVEDDSLEELKARGAAPQSARVDLDEAEFANRDGRLRPGLFARVEAKLD